MKNREIAGLAEDIAELAAQVPAGLVEMTHVQGIGPKTAGLLQAGKAAATALEINAHYERLDLNDMHARAARDAGVRLVLGTDAHDPDSLGMMRLGVATARRGWARPGDVPNTLALDEFLAAIRPRQGQ